MPRAIPHWGQFSIDLVTQPANTAIAALIPPKYTVRAVLTRLHVEVGTTAHTWFVMQPQGQTVVAVNAAAGQNVFTLREQPAPSNPVAANDYLAWTNPDGTSSFDIVQSVSGLTITLTNNLPVALLGVGPNPLTPVWFFGAPGDTNARTHQPHPSFRAPAAGSGTQDVIHQAGTDLGCVVQGLQESEPMLIYNANPTVQGYLRNASGVYQPQN